MKRMIILAGPQAAGKSSCLAKLIEVFRYFYPCLPDSKDIEPFVLQEARQIIVHKYHTMGAIFLTQEQEKEIMAVDFLRMERILEEVDERLLYFDECNVFTLAHAQAHGVMFLEEYLPRYIKILCHLHTVIIFLDIPPEISWARRQVQYHARLSRFPEEVRSKVFKRFHDYLYLLHPALHKIYDRIDLPKIKIDSAKPIELVIKEIIGFLRDGDVI